MLTPTGAFKFITLGPAPSKTLLVLQVFAQVLNILKQIPVPSFTVLPANSFSPNLVKYSMCAYFLNFYAGKKKNIFMRPVLTGALVPETSSLFLLYDAGTKNYLPELTSFLY